ncbi:hypothetical protein RRG08_020778 [Elysia crispata]|uniref:Uncharacterized protein n=1 Tax=Elysia crispata TaxID=231223 RepID=A0AAE1D439_9GAST|nr:hypothetical protein RRG08_020778 [Elysia crispata]
MGRLSTALLIQGRNKEVYRVNSISCAVKPDGVKGCQELWLATCCVGRLRRGANSRLLPRRCGVLTWKPSRPMTSAE